MQYKFPHSQRNSTIFLRTKQKAGNLGLRENRLEERSSDEGFGGGLELDEVGEEVRGRRRVEGEEDVLSLPEGGELDGQIAMVVGSGEERQRLVSGSSGHGWGFFKEMNLSMN